MKIALLSDIHANLPALEAVLKNIDARKPDAIYCLGDLVGYNVWPNEVIGEIRKRSIATLAGNHDLKVKSGISSLVATKPDKNHAYQIVGEEEKTYLLDLPAHLCSEFMVNGKKIRMLMVHGSPRSVDEYLLEDMNEDLLVSIMQEAGADILCFGHSHKPYHRILPVEQDGKIIYKHAINTGSVGKPKDGDPRACYVLLHIHKNSSLSYAESLQVEFVRVAYDIEKVAKAIEDSPLPNEFADMLRKAFQS